MRHLASITLGVTTALLATTALVVAQPAPSMPEPAAPPAQTTENPMVAATAATHVAVLGAAEGAAAPADATGAAWFALDPQNNTLMWTIELTNFTPIAIGIACGEGEAGPAAAEVTVDLATNGLASPIQGQANLEQAVFEDFGTGECWVIATGEGNEIRGVIEPAELPA